MSEFHMSMEEVLNLEQEDFVLMFQFAWTKFNIQRDPMSFKKKGSEDIIYFNQDEKGFISHV